MPGHPRHHLAAHLLPPPQHGLLPSGHGLLVQEVVPSRPGGSNLVMIVQTSSVRGLVSGGLEEPLQPRLAGGDGQDQHVLLHDQLSVRGCEGLQTNFP